MVLLLRNSMKFSIAVLLLWPILCHGDVQFFEDIETPKPDDRSYRAFTLENGLKVLVVSDPKIDTSAAALQTNIGGLTDPWDMQGLAHFTEHMLFIASKKYPEINGYSKFINDHGGRWNGFTSTDVVAYFFSVGSNHTLEALDRFAQFFLAPLFTREAVNREISIVDSEFFFRNKQDVWRNWFLRSSRATPNHDLIKFYAGNRVSLQTLPEQKGLVPRDEVVKYYKRWYSSNLMSLVLLGSESLDALTKMATDRFTRVRNLNISAQSWTDPYGPMQLKRYIKAEQIKDKDELSFEFQLTDVRPLYKSKPDRYISYIMNNQGKGSLTSFLKTKGWAEDVGFEAFTIATGIGYGILKIKLTEEGQLREKEISIAVFQYFNILRNEGPQERIFDEIRKIYDLTFNYKEKSKSSDTVIELVDNLRRYPYKEVISGPYRVWEYDPKAITSLLNEIVPDNLMIYRFSKNAFNESELDKVEQWYGVRHSDNPIDPELMTSINEPGMNKAFQLPEPNAFIAETTELKEPDLQNGPLPELVKSDEFIQAWYLQEKDFRVPKAVQKIKISSRFANPSATQASELELFVKLVSDALKEDLFSATKAGLMYRISATLYGITIDISGFQDKQGSLIETIINRLTSFEPDPIRFLAVKEEYVRQLKNFAVQNAFRQNRAYLWDSMVDRKWSDDQKLVNAEKTTFDDIMSFRQLFFTETHVDMLAVGNLARMDVVNTANKIEDVLKSAEEFRAMSAKDLLPLRQTFIPEGKSFLHQKEHSVEGDNSILIHFQMTEKSMKNDLVAALIPSMMRLVMFTQLRTIEELGYVASTYAQSFTSGVNGINILIQTAKLPPFVSERVDVFLSSYQEIIRNMTDEEFASRKESLATLRFEKPKSIRDRLNKYWSEINTRFYNFDWEALERKVLDEITKDDVQKAFDTYLAPSSQRRKQLIFYLTGTKAKEAGYDPRNNCEDSKVTCIDDAQEFKEEQEKYDPPEPFKTIKELEEECPRECN